VKVPIDAILWRKWNQATFDTLIGESRGQYHITLTTLPELSDFFASADQTDDTDIGGFTLTFEVQPFEGDPPVDRQELSVRFMGSESARRDWNIPSQRPETAYPLWRVGRGPPTQYSKTLREYLIIVRDVNGGYHARWISDGEFDNLPALVRSKMQAKGVGVLFL
jgi:hypothetical protein